MKLSHKEVQKALLLLSPMLTESRKNKIVSVISSRTRSLTVLLENVHDRGNENAVLRSMDAFGALSLHKVTTIAPTRIKKERGIRTDAGTRQWIDISDWSDLDSCVTNLRNSGYRIASTSPDSQVSISDIDFCQKTVVTFGNERSGISEDLSRLSDMKFSLPMCGFVESFNISVCVAVTLYHAYMQRTERLGTNGDLSTADQEMLTLKYWMDSVGISEQQLVHLLQSTPPQT